MAPPDAARKTGPGARAPAWALYFQAREQISPTEPRCPIRERTGRPGLNRLRRDGIRSASDHHEYNQTHGGLTVSLGGFAASERTMKGIEISFAVPLD
jgi:hypothetical protein